MNEIEIKSEIAYRIEERLAILTEGQRESTLSEQYEAQEEAHEWERRYRAERTGV